MGYRAKTIWDEATRVRDDANTAFAKAQEELRIKVDRTNAALSRLNRLREEVAAGELERGMRVFAAVRGVKRGPGPAPLEALTVSESSLELRPQTASTVVDLIKGGSLAVAGGAVGMAGALGLATAVGTASTGTAIATLSGAAANSATLAWLGGGALSAGGAGMTGGMVALGGVFAGPAVAVAGAAAWAAAAKDRTGAEEHAKVVAHSVAALLTDVERFRLIDTRVAEVAASLTVTAAAVDRLAQQMAAHLAPRGYNDGAGIEISYDDLAPEARNNLLVLGEALKALHAQLKIDIVAEAQDFMQPCG